MHPGELIGALQGISFRFRTDWEELHRYAQLHLAPLLESGRGQEAAVEVRVTSVLHWVSGQPWPRARWGRATAEWPRVDRDLYVNERELLWFRVDDLRDLVLHLQAQEDGSLSLDGTFFFRLGNRALTDYLRRRWLGRRVHDFERRRFPTLLSYMVYYPLWWRGEVDFGRHPIHAAAVATPHGAVLLAGASGVGKSTISTALAAQNGNKLLSDSFVLLEGSKVLAVPEPILLDRPALRWLGARTEILCPIDHRYMLERVGHHVVPAKLQLEASPALLVFPRRGSQWRSRQMSSQEAWSRLSAANLMVNDLRRYYALAATWEQL
ncbi:hypothetical protein HRbin30_01012 [bacterium HR30]|nr:hypothetical protein HRbin30_01012 [bacterium HR30]